jgi:hypothetical protein
MGCQHVRAEITEQVDVVRMEEELQYVPILMRVGGRAAES